MQARQGKSAQKRDMGSVFSVTDAEFQLEQQQVPACRTGSAASSAASAAPSPVQVAGARGRCVWLVCVASVCWICMGGMNIKSISPGGFICQ